MANATEHADHWVGTANPDQMRVVAARAAGDHRAPAPPAARDGRARRELAGLLVLIAALAGALALAFSFGPRAGLAALDVLAVAGGLLLISDLG